MMKSFEGCLVTTFLIGAIAACSSSPDAATPDQTGGDAGESAGDANASGDGATTSSDGGSQATASLAITAGTPMLFVSHGGTASATVAITRAGWDGPVTIDVGGLLGGLSASAITVPPGATSAKIEFSATTTADSKPVTVTLTATGNANLTATAKMSVEAPVASADPSFGSGGMVETLPGSNPEDMAIQPDGKILVLTVAAVYRFDPSGALDATFGAGGKASIGVPSYFMEGTRGLVVQPDGKIVVLFSERDNTVGGNNALVFGIARLLPSGAYDSSFGSGGVVTDNAGGFDHASASGIALQSDGNILVVGQAYDVATSSNVHGVVTRLLPSGALDTSFANAGRLVTYWNGNGTSASASRVIAKGTLPIVIGGRVNSGVQSAVVAKLTQAGALDATFGTGGVYTQSEAVVGIEPRTNGFALVEYNGLDADLAGVTATGALDPSFGAVFGDHSNGDYVTPEFAVWVDPTDKTFVAQGNITKNRLEIEEFVFGVAHPAVITFAALASSSDAPIAKRVAVAPDGRIVALASSYGTQSIVLARIFP